MGNFLAWRPITATVVVVGSVVSIGSAAGAIVCGHPCDAVVSELRTHEPLPPTTPERAWTSTVAGTTTAAPSLTVLASGGIVANS